MRTDILFTTWAGMPAICFVGALGDKATMLLRGAQFAIWTNADDEVLCCGDAYTSDPIDHTFCNTPLGSAPTLPLWEVIDTWFHYGEPYARLRINAQQRNRHDAWLNPDLQYQLQVSLNAHGLSMQLEIYNSANTVQEVTAFGQNVGPLLPNSQIAVQSITTRFQNRHLPTQGYLRHFQPSQFM